MAENNRHLLAPSAAIIKTDNFSASRSLTLASSYGRTGPIRPRSFLFQFRETPEAGGLQRRSATLGRAGRNQTKVRAELRPRLPPPGPQRQPPAAWPAQLRLFKLDSASRSTFACMRARARAEQTLHLSIRLGRVQPEFMSYRYGGSTSPSPLCGSRPAERGEN